MYACLSLSCNVSIITRHHISIATSTFIHIFRRRHGIEHRTDWIGWWAKRPTKESSSYLFGMKWFPDDYHKWIPDPFWMNIQHPPHTGTLFPFAVVIKKSCSCRGGRKREPTPPVYLAIGLSPKVKQGGPGAGRHSRLKGGRGLCLHMDLYPFADLALPLFSFYCPK